MKAFLDDLYYGNINPNDQEFQRGTAYAKALQIVSASEEQLNELLLGKEKELLLQFVDAQAEIDGITAVEKFKLGFRMGARFMMEILTEDERIFKDI